MSRWNPQAALAAMLLIAASLAPCQASASDTPPPVYRIRPLKTQGELVPRYPVAINDLGVIVGIARDRSKGVGWDVGFRLEGGVMSRIDGSDFDLIRDLNDAGDVLGNVPNTPAVWWNDGRYEEMPTIRQAQRFNNLGVLAGVGQFGSEGHAATFDHGVLTDLGTLGGGQTSEAVAVNDSGVVAGHSTIRPNHWQKTHAFIWQAGVMHDLGTLGGDSSYALDINAHGHVLGTAQDESGDYRPFLFNGSKKVRIPSLGAGVMSPFRLNGDDEVVGGSSQGAFLYRNGVTYALGSLLDDSGAEWGQLLAATAINAHGVIVGYGVYRGHSKGFVATPVKR